MKQSKRNERGKKTMAVLTAECERTFSVSPEKSKEFLNHKTNIKQKKSTEETLLKISKIIHNENENR